MAEKHKSKYKSPKDFEKSQKPQTRKDVKDYVGEDAANMVPGGVKGVVPNVPRKYATDVIDNVENMVPDIKERLYKKVEEGEYSTEHARKVFEKLQIEDTDGFLEKLERIDHGAITNSMVKPENEEKLQERVDKLSAENKERLIREYVRRKIAIMIREQADAQTAEPATAAAEPSTPTPDEAPEIPDSKDAQDIVDTPKEKGPAQVFQQYIISKVRQSNNPIGAVTSIMLNLLITTITKVEAETGIESDNESLKTDLFVWMQNNNII
jgi:hypothetical protein